MNIITEKSKLHHRSVEIGEITNEIKSLAEEMSRIRNERHAAGVAAPQLGHTVRLITLKIKGKEVTLVNPKITKKRGVQLSHEECLSIPNEIWLMRRPETLKLKGTTLEGDTVTFSLRDYDARVACHEVDHLDGILIDSGVRVGTTEEKEEYKLAHG